VVSARDPAAATSEPSADLRERAAKQGMRRAYDAAAPRYERFIMPSFVPIARRILWYARPNSDDIHVDLATGTGLVPAVADDRRMMTCIPPWRVGMDLSRSMLQAARLASPPTKLVQGDLDRLPFRSASLDLLTLSLALHHLPTPRHALPELRRVLRPKGRLVLAAWGDELGPLWQAFDDWFEAARLGTSRTIHRSDVAINTPATLTAALTEVGGFSRVKVTPERPPIIFPSLADFWEWRVSFPATHRALAAVTPERYADLRSSCLGTLAPLAEGGDVRADQTLLFAYAQP
jgi:ubiquinone/menaquinone biosynthesis C-methylase UbiE